MEELKLAAAWSARLKLRAEGAKLWAEGAKLWAEKIIEAYGNIQIEWRYRDGGYDCWLDVDGGVTYRHEN